MPRLEFEVLGRGSPSVFEVLLPKPRAVPDGYTPIMLLTEWLTLNCRGDWASRANHRGVVVRFVSRDDHDRAVARFLATPDVVRELTGSRRPAAARRGLGEAARRRPGRATG